jgi:hypothetical protein
LKPLDRVTSQSAKDLSANQRKDNQNFARNIASIDYMLMALICNCRREVEEVNEIRKEIGTGLKRRLIADRKTAGCPTNSMHNQQRRITHAAHCNSACVFFYQRSGKVFLLEYFLRYPIDKKINIIDKNELMSIKFCIEFK